MAGCVESTCLGWPGPSVLSGATAEPLAVADSLVVHPAVRRVVEALLDRLDVTAPGVVEAAYLTGSVALGDFRAGPRWARLGPSGARISDVDVVLVSALEPTQVIAEVQALAESVRARHRWPTLDGLLLSRNMLQGGPATSANAVRFHGQRVWASGVASPVVWHELADHAMAVRGSRPGATAVWTDRRELESWTRINLDTYWRQWHQTSLQLMTPPGLMSLTSFGPVWGVLGVSRLAALLETGQILSKTAAGHWALGTAERVWAPLLEDCVRLRTGGRGDLPRVRRRRLTLDYVNAVVTAQTG